MFLFKRFLLLVVCVTALSSIVYAQQTADSSTNKPEVATDGPPPQGGNQQGGKQGQGGRPARVITITAAEVVEKFVAPTASVSGAIYITDESNIAAERASKVVKVFVTEGDKVEIGTPIMQLDDTAVSYELAVAEANAVNAKEDMDYNKSTFERNKVLYQNKSISEQTYQNLLTENNKSESTYNAAVNQVSILQREKDKMLITSPIEGFITSVDVNDGEWVSIGETIANVAANTFEAQLNLPERLLPYIHGSGDNVSIRTSYGTKEGKVTFVSIKGDIFTNSFPVKIFIGQDDELREGMRATIYVPSGEAITALYVPIDAIVTRSGVSGVYVISPHGTVSFVPIEVIGFSGEGRTVRSDGLKEGMRVVVSGSTMVSDGSKVKVVEY